MRNKRNNVFLEKNSRFIRLFAFVILLCFNFLFSQNPTNTFSDFRNKEFDYHSQSTTSTKDNSPLEKETALDLNKSSSSSEAIIYTTDGAYIYSEDNVLSSKIVKIKPAKERTIAKNLAKKEKIQLVAKKTTRKVTTLKNLFKLNENPSYLSNQNKEKNIVVSANNNNFNSKKLFLSQSQYFSKNILYFHSKQNYQYHISCNFMLVFENYFTRPPPKIL